MRKGGKKSRKRKRGRGEKKKEEKRKTKGQRGGFILILPLKISYNIVQHLSLTKREKARVGGPPVVCGVPLRGLLSLRGGAGRRKGKFEEGGGKGRGEAVMGVLFARSPSKILRSIFLSARHDGRDLARGEERWGEEKRSAKKGKGVEEAGVRCPRAGDRDRGVSSLSKS